MTQLSSSQNFWGKAVTASHFTHRVDAVPRSPLFIPFMFNLIWSTDRRVSLINDASNMFFDSKISAANSRRDWNPLQKTSVQRNSCTRDSWFYPKAYNELLYLLCMSLDHLLIPLSMYAFWLASLLDSSFEITIIFQ